MYPRSYGSTDGIESYRRLRNVKSVVPTATAGKQRQEANGTLIFNESGVRIPHRLLMTIDIETFRTALLTDKINTYWDRFTPEQWEDILAIAAEHSEEADLEEEIHEAHLEGYNLGEEYGFGEGFEEGKLVGYDDGYDAGFADGLAEARSDEPEDSV